MGKKVLIVIGERMGKGTNVAKGIEAAGGDVYVIPGMAADMKLGDVMKVKGADLGICFCGSGGAGALMAAHKYNYRVRHHMESVAEGVAAVRAGYEVLGFRFMDTEELGRRITEAYYEIHGVPEEQQS